MEEKLYSYILLQKLNFIRKFVVVALALILFGAGAILLSLIVFPAIMLFTGDKQKRPDRIRSVIRHTFTLYLVITSRLNILTIETEGIDRLENLKGCLLICNHPSLIDVIIIMSHLRRVQCVVNNKLWTNPIVGIIVRAAEYIRNDIDPQTFLSNCKKMIERGENILIFPEGTRSEPDHPMKMCRGFANLAFFAETDIQALHLSCKPIWLTKKTPWYDIPSSRIKIILKVGPKFTYANYESNAPRSIRVRALMRDVQNYYKGYENP